MGKGKLHNLDHMGNMMLKLDFKIRDSDSKALKLHDTEGNLSHFAKPKIGTVICLLLSSLFFLST